ncbi:MAG: HAMP domain-containing sensor histidine kinase, partial [Acidimicrobiales bacterium]
MSIRSRITALATAAVLLVLVVAGFAIVHTQHRLLVRSFDESLANETATVADPIVATGRPGALERLGDDDTVAQVVMNGRVAAASSRLAKATSRPIIAPPPDGITRVVREIDDLPSEPGHFRVLTRTVTGPDGRVAVVHVAANLDDVRDSISALTRVMAGAVPLLLAALAGLIWWFVGRTLRPVEAIRREVSAIGGADLHRRLSVPAVDDEVGRLALTMNDMLDRIERSAEQQQRFAADASHELRSPLARMRTELEVDLAHPDRADLASTHRSALDEVIGLQHLVDDLLLLARSDATAEGVLTPELVDLDDVVLRVARQARTSGRVQVDTTGIGPAQVSGDARALARLVSNLVDNAVHHASSTVTVEVRDGDGSAQIVVADDGPGVR